MAQGGPVRQVKVECREPHLPRACLHLNMFFNRRCRVANVRVGGGMQEEGDVRREIRAATRSRVERQRIMGCRGRAGDGAGLVPVAGDDIYDAGRAHTRVKNRRWARNGLLSTSLTPRSGPRAWEAVPGAGPSCAFPSGQHTAEAGTPVLAPPTPQALYRAQAGRAAACWRLRQSETLDVRHMRGTGMDD